VGCYWLEVNGIFLVTIYQSTRRIIPDELHLHYYRCENSNIIFKIFKKSGNNSSSALNPYVLKCRNRALKVTNTITIVVRESRVLIAVDMNLRRFEGACCVHLQGFLRMVVKFLQHFITTVLSSVRWLVANLSRMMSGFDSRSFHVGFNVDKVLLRSFFSSCLVFPCTYLVSCHQHSVLAFYSSDINDI
jgi:hypothetical protein